AVARQTYPGFVGLCRPREHRPCAWRRGHGALGGPCRPRAGTRDEELLARGTYARRAGARPRRAGADRGGTAARGRAPDARRRPGTGAVLAVGDRPRLAAPRPRPAR